MAATTPTNVDSSILEAWSRETLRRTKVMGYWSRFIGTAIKRKTELLNKPGDLIHIQVTDPLTGAGIEGDTTLLEGSEENLATSEIKTSPVLYRHAVRNYERAVKKSILDLDSEARDRLEEWMANKIDTKRFEMFTGTTAPVAGEAYTPNVFVVGGGTGVNDVALTDDLTVIALQTLMLKLRLQQAKPIIVDGKPHFVLVTHPNTTFQLKQEARYESWVREAAERGKTNPLFSGALAVVDGMIIHDHENVPRANNASAVSVSKGIAFGAEAFVEALDENIEYRTRDFDYGNQRGIAVRFAFQPRRALELSSVQVYATAEAVT